MIDVPHRLTQKETKTNKILVNLKNQLCTNNILKLEYLKLKLLVIVDHHATVKFKSEKCTNRPSRAGIK